jgi:hypothetical protein
LLGANLLFPLTAFAQEEPDSLTAHDISHAEKLIGLKFTDATRDSMLDGMKYHLGNYDAMRKISVPNSALPAMVFRPVPIGMKLGNDKKPFQIRKPVHVIMPDKIDDLSTRAPARGADRTREMPRYNYGLPID